ncbi:cytochrome P450 [uncultured Nocardioides sp.]|uniref:cytochrome P450 n=1 Tax=uncultured Nocardioides sp. TaxID=198441 RepID=UPI00261576E1|nr:cytochrome P450 [uncultured Nocardioides sp.]
MTLPDIRTADSTIALLRDPYRYISRRAAELGEDIFETRLLLRPTTCMTGVEAAGVFYDPSRFQRAGAAPPPLQKTLFGQGGVQGLDDEDHRQRKAMFLQIVERDRVEALVEVVTREWQRAVDGWIAVGQIKLYPRLQVLLTRAVCEWAGVPLPEAEVEVRARQLTALFDDAGRIGVGHLRSRAARKAADRWAAEVIDQIRAGKLDPPPSSAAYVVAHYRERDGRPMAPRVAAVELLNVLRPTVATAVYITFVAHALDAHPAWKERLANGDGGEDLAFVEEVRRHYPFFPAVAAVVREPFEWRGHRFPPGRRVLLDLYGTNHESRYWRDPDRFDPGRFLGEEPDRFAFVPQGGGEPAVHHRCPGEPISTRLMTVALDRMVRHMTYTPLAVPTALDFGRLPALPAGGYPIRLATADRAT